MNGTKRSKLLNDMLAAHSRYDAAGKARARAVRAALPIGTRVSVTLGRALVIGPVVGHGAEWCNSVDVHVQNQRTGKTRIFDPTCRGNHLLVIDDPCTEPTR